MGFTQLGPESLCEFMQKAGVRGSLVQVQLPTPTVEAAAQAVGTSPENIVKSLLFIADDEPVLVIASGTQRVAVSELALQLQVDEDLVRLAKPKEVLMATGYPVGAVPPFGHVNRLVTYMDVTLLEVEQVYAGGGASNYLLQTTPDEIQQISGANVIKLQEQV
jgi:prolyl-tRNA editing enzyme YbaK/EbsC (Cys-tRNA(Pro) deacylase)